jgi:hypothetical protein
LKIFYDCEFVDTGDRILPISIGMVTENGRELYRVLADIDQGEIYEKIRHHSWLMAHVVPHLPLRGKVARSPANNYTWLFSLDPTSLLVVDRRQLRNEVRTFIEETPDPELWAWYGAYDHVLLAQLFGRMMDKPAKMPMWTNDIRQLQHTIGVTDDELEAAVPHDGAAHNALVDAKWNRDAYLWLTER